MAFTTSPREYSRRIAIAKEFYRHHTYAKIRQQKDPVAEYKYRLGEYATKHPMMVKSATRAGNENIKRLDYLAGARFLKNAAYKSDRVSYAKILEAHSPNAGMLTKPIERQAYSGERATQAAIAVNDNLEKTARSQPELRVGQRRANPTIPRRPQAVPKQLTAQQQGSAKGTPVPYTPSIKASREADYEYGKRLHKAQQFYVLNKNKPLSRDPAAQYKFELGKISLESPEHYRIKDRTGNRNMETLDQEVGQALIGKGICNKEGYQQVLEKHSPNAGILQHPQRRQEYAKGIAGVSDKFVNKPNYRPDRTKHGEQHGRAKSTIEERALRQPSVKQATKQHACQIEHER